MAVDIWASIYWITGLTRAFLLFSFLFFIGGMIYVIKKENQGEKKTFPWQWMAIFVSVGTSIWMVGHYSRYNDERNYYDKTHETFVAKVVSDNVGLEADGVSVQQRRGSGDDARRAYFWQIIERPTVGSCVEVGFIRFTEAHRGEKSHHYIGVEIIELKPVSCEKLSSYHEVKRVGASHLKKAEAYSSKN